MRKALIPVVAVVVLAGCATQGDIQRGLSSLQGWHIDKFIERIGYPQNERLVGGHHIYEWSVATTNAYGATINSCAFTVEVDSNNIVNNSFARWNGPAGANNCVWYMKALGVY